MNIVLINPRFGPVGDEAPISSAVFPYGLAHVAQALIDVGNHVKIYDPFADEPDTQSVEADIVDFDADWIGITAMSTQYAQLEWLVELIRNKQQVKTPKIMLGGLLPTYSYQTVLEHLPVDVCVIGDGVITAPKIIGEQRENWKDIPGVAFKDSEGETICTGPGEFVEDLDSLPTPPYDLFNMDRYCRGRLWIDDPTIKERYRAGVEAPKKIMTVLSAWGCPYKCKFCSRSTDRARMKSVSALIKEIEHLKENYAIEAVHFVDELLFINKKRGLELAEAIAPLDLLWDAQARVNTIDAELCAAVKNSGCTALGLGIESGSDKILQAMNKKGASRKKNIDAVQAAEGAGLLVRLQLIMGYPGETPETLRETVSLFKEIHHPGRRFALILPLPGSELYDKCREEGRIQDEHEYLLTICRGYGGEDFFMNFMNMPDQDVLALKRSAEKTMERNYLLHLLMTLKLGEFRAFKKSSFYHRSAFSLPFTGKDAIRWVLQKIGLLNFVRKCRGNYDKYAD